MTQNNTLTLYDMRKQSGKSGASAAKRCNTSWRSLRNWELGVSIPDVVNTAILLEVYGYTFDDLDMTPFHEKQKRDENAALAKEQ